VAGIIPALRAHDDIRVLGEEIDNLAFAFVTPLSPDQDGICHEFSEKGCLKMETKKRPEDTEARALGTFSNASGSHQGRKHIDGASAKIGPASKSPPASP
jgi:hypothetical protein